MAPDVSVLIPAYNCAVTLRRAVMSALDQAGVNVEVVIADDASTDDTLSIALELAIRNPGVIVNQQSENKRISGTLNNAAEYATGRYLMRCDSDDWLEPGCLARMAAALDANPDVGFVYGCRRYYGRRSDVYVPKPFNVDDFNVHNAAGYAYMFRREIWGGGLRWKALGTFGGAVIDLEDWQHILGMLGQGVKGMALADTLALHYTFGWGGTWQELKSNEQAALAELKARFPNVRAECL